jgi:serine/threonine protein kinase/tetratricopeptide (TPR) repeat protein
MADEPKRPSDDEPDDESGRSGPISAELVELGDEQDESDARSEAPELPRGSTVGRYSVLGRLAESGADVVYAAFDPDTQKKVAIKLVRVTETEADADEDAARQRMLEEAEALAGLSHPCIAEVYEVGTIDRWIYLVMEFLDGIDLRKWIEARDDPFPWREVLRVFREAGRGLVAAHKAGIVHRDFQPSSVLLCKGGRICVLDFGLGREEAPEESDDLDVSELKHSFPGDVPTQGDRPATITRTGQTLGTPWYMAPEVHITHRSDAKSDQFSFCVALYEALYGERPFQATRPIAFAMEAVRHNVRPVPSGSSVPGWLRAVVLRGLHPRPDERWPSMEALLRELARDPVASRKRWALGGVALVVIAAGAFVLARQVEEERRSCTPDEALLVGVWDPDRRAELEAAVTGTGRPWAAETWSTLEDGIDRWTAHWLELSEAACVATRIRGDATEELYDLRVSCLERQLGQIEALGHLLERADPATVDGAYGLVTELVSPKTCTFTDDLTARPAIAEAVADRVEAAQRDLDQAEAMRRDGRHDQAASHAESLVRAIEPLGHAPLHVDALLLLGRAQLHRGELQAAEDALAASATAAARAGLDRQVVEAFTDLATVIAARGRPAEAERFAALAEAIVDRRQYDRLRPALAATLGDVAAAAHRPADALSHYYRAAELETHRDDTHPLRRAPLFRKIGRMLSARADHATAIGHFREALATLQEALGPRHPALADVLEELAEAQRGAGEIEDALATLNRALEVREPVARPIDQGRALVRIAEIEAAAGKLTEAREHFGQAERVLEPVGAAAEGVLARALVGHGNLLLDEGKAGDAIEPLRRAVALHETAGEPADLADARFTLARALWVEPKLHRSALELAREARRAYAAIGMSRTAELSSVQHWLDEHDPHSGGGTPRPRRPEDTTEASTDIEPTEPLPAGTEASEGDGVAP